MRRYPRLRFLRHWALAAALLLALAPTAGRLLTTAGGSGGWAELCTMTGLKAVWIGGAATPAHANDAHYAGDCAYCPLLGAMAHAAPFLWQLPPASFARWLPPPARVRDVPTPRVGQLGARGPPALA